MKLKNLFRLALAALACSTLTASAQIGFDTYKGVRTYVMTPPFTTKIGTALYTNGPFDKAYLIGVGKIDFMTLTNVGNAALAATVYTSPDQTNWTALQNYALIPSPTTESITNTYYALGTNALTASNSEMLQGTVTTPNAALTGFATPYSAYFPFTNTAAVTLSSSPEVEIGFNLTDQQRYIMVVYANTGGSNSTVSAILTAPNAHP